MKKLLKKNIGNNGFTLVELIVVIAILGVLMAVLVPQYIQYVEKGRVAADISSASSIETAVNVLVADGTLESGNNVTWKTDGSIAVADDSSDSKLSDLKKLLGITESSVPHKSTSTTETDVTFTITANSVTCAPDYKAWQ